MLASHKHHFGVAGAAQCPASYANEGFGESNAFFWYVPEVEAFFICMRGRAREGVAYEVLPNYDSPGFPSSYWNTLRTNRLPKESQEACQLCYPEPKGKVRSRGSKKTPSAGLPVLEGRTVSNTTSVHNVNILCVELTEVNDG